MPPRIGTRDLLPADQPYWQTMRSAAVSLAERYGYRAIETPILEAADLFLKATPPDDAGASAVPVGEQGGRLMALRPEGSAPTLRAFFEAAMDREPQPVRLYYIAPMLRVGEQTVRFGMQAIGAGGPALDVEVIELGWRWFEALRLTGVTLWLAAGDEIRSGLVAAGVPFSVEERLATGPPARLRFELRAEGPAGSIPLGGGGRADGLSRALGFPPTPMVGAELDMPRTAALLEAQHPQELRGPDVCAIPLEPASRPHVQRLAAALRQRGYRVVLDVSDAGLESGLQEAARRGARVAVVAGPALDARGQAVVRDLIGHDQVTAWDAEVPDTVRRIFAATHRHEHEGPIR